jgi:hypothetical protein
MYAQLTYFDGPRSPHQLTAADYATQHRIMPLVEKFTVQTFVLRRDDGSEVVVSIAETEQALLDMHKAIVSSTPLPEEDIELKLCPDRIELYPVHSVHPEGP